MKSKIIYSFMVDDERYGISLSLLSENVICAFLFHLYRDDYWIDTYRQIYGHTINHGEKIIFVGGNAGPSECFNPYTSRRDAAVKQVIRWLESLEYSEILAYASKSGTEE